MSGFIWFFAAVVGAGVLWLGHFRNQHDGGGPLSLTDRLILFLPALFFALVLIETGGGGERIQFTWTGMEFPLRPGVAVTFGGNPERDDVYLPGFHERALVVERRGRGTAAEVLVRREDPTVLVSLGDHKGEALPWGYRPLGKAAAIESPRADGGDSTVAFERGYRDGYLQGPMGKAEFSTRQVGLAPGYAALTWNRAFGTEPLSGRPLNLGFLIHPKPDGARSCELTRTFVYRRPARVASYDYFVALADPSAHLAGMQEEPVEKRLLPDPGGVAELTMTPSGCALGENGAEAWLGKEVGFRLSMNKDTLRVELAAPVRFSFPRNLFARPSREALTVMAVSGLRQSDGGVDLGADHATRTVGFSRRLSAGMAALRGEMNAPDGIRVDAPVSELEVPWGAVLRLGSDAQTVLSTRKVGLPWLEFWLLLATTCALAVATGGRSVSFRLLAIVTPTLLLLSMRLLLAHRLWAAYPASQFGVYLALEALFLVPAAILAGSALGSLSENENSESGHRLRHVGLVLSLAAPLYLLGARLGGAPVGGSQTVACMVSLACAAVCAGWRYVSRWCRHLEDWGDGGSLQLLLCLGGIAVLRLALAWLMGWREAAFIFGLRLAMSIVWTPTSVLFTALLALRMEARIMENGRTGMRARSNLGIIVWTTVLFVFWHGISVLAGDFGAIVVDLPASLLVMAGIAGVHLRGREWRQAPMLAIPFALVLVVLFVPHAVSTPLKWKLSDPVNDPLAVNRRPAYYRMLSTLNREELDRIGTLTTEALRTHLGIANTLSAGSALGKGYLQAELPREGSSFLASLLSDNTVAVLIAPDWGLGGHWGLCLVLMTIPIVVASGRFMSKRRFALLVQLSAVGYLVYGSLYMIGANTFREAATLLPFTGRNLHLLNVQSGSDVVESALLLALVAFCTGRKL